MQPMSANLLNFMDLENANGGLAYLACLLAYFSLLFPLRPQLCFEPSAVFKTWKQTERPAVAAISAVLHFNWLQNVTQGGTHYEAQNRIEAF